MTSFDHTEQHWQFDPYPEAPQEWSYEEDDLVWHYTNAAAMQNILTKHELWASDTSFMNDLHERRLADEYLIKAKRKLGTKFPSQLESYLDHVGNWYGTFDDKSPDDRYLLCGSSNGDSLTNWRAYAGTEGLTYAIGLDKHVPLSVLAVDGEKGFDGRSPEITDWFAVNYNVKNAQTEAKTAVDRIIDALDGQESGNTREVITTIADETERLRNRTKHQGFIHEEEWRVIVKAESELVRYRSGPRGVIPYVSLTGSGSSQGRVTRTPSRLPIREIRISPGQNRERARISVVKLIGSTDYRPYYGIGRNVQEISINLSEIPFR